ncbi:hypothetical protein [Nonomuraea sp. NPDC049695]|uniref:hypothetical protein n=1 Tax=Nonomuraea sp. NPDC049695 TaxID=3154734 RepID=UPI00341708B8
MAVGQAGEAALVEEVPENLELGFGDDSEGVRLDVAVVEFELPQRLRLADGDLRRTDVLADLQSQVRQDWVGEHRVVERDLLDIERVENRSDRILMQLWRAHSQLQVPPSSP